MRANCLKMILKNMFKIDLLGPMSAILNLLGSICHSVVCKKYGGNFIFSGCNFVNVKRQSK